MTTLFEQLVQIKSDITEVQAAEFRSCLITVSKHINTEPESLALSLQDWGRWLDDGGYGSENFAAILQQITEAELGVPAASTLWTYAQSICAAAEGIPSLIEHVQTDYPGLEQRITSLEALALDDQGLIEQTAGGMSKTGQIVTGVVGGVLVTGLVTYGIHRVFKTRRARSLKEAAESELLQQERDMEKYLKDRIDEPKHISERGLKDRKQMTYDDTEELRDTFKARSTAFDFHAYARSTGDNLMRKGLTYERKRQIASDLYQDYYNADKRRVLTDEERRLCQDLPENQYRDVESFIKLMEPTYDKKLEKNPFDVYAEHRFTVEKSEHLLKMTDAEFIKFAKGEGKNFLRKDAYYVRDVEKELKADIRLDVKFEEVYFQDTVIGDIEKDTAKAIGGAAEKLETKTENFVVGATNDFENTVTSAENDFI